MRPRYDRSVAAKRTGRVVARDVAYYYEIHGEGRPLLLLHGGLGSIEMVAAVLADLARHRQVIAVDLEGHGRTALGERAASFATWGDDMAAILDHLGLLRADVMGYSLGGGVAIRLAIQHAARVRRLIVVSTPFARDGFFPDVLAMQTRVAAASVAGFRASPLYQTYQRIAPRPEDFPRLLDRVGAMLRTPYDWHAEIPKITAHTLLVFGDSDTYRLEHVIELYHLLGGNLRDAGWTREHVATNRLAILPDVTHYDIISSPQLLTTVERFLAG
jgi:pimeloyl-ACP methyl ester carboxylesterase